MYNSVNFCPIFKIFFCLKACENRQLFRIIGTFLTCFTNSARPVYLFFEWKSHKNMHYFGIRIIRFTKNWISLTYQPDQGQTTVDSDQKIITKTSPWLTDCVTDLSWSKCLKMALKHPFICLPSENWGIFFIKKLIIRCMSTIKLRNILCIQHKHNVVVYCFHLRFKKGKNLKTILVLSKSDTQKLCYV